MEHPSNSLLAKLAPALGRLSPEDVRHLATCRRCKRQLFRLVRQEQRRLDVGGCIDYTEVLERSATDTVQCTERVEAERRAAVSLLAELLALPDEERTTTVLPNERFHTYALASYALDRCQEAVSHDPGLALKLAQLARFIAEQVDPRSCGGSAALADLEAYAVAMEANALRVSGELLAAAETFLEVRRLQDRGGADLDLAARIDNLESSLRRDLRQFGPALSLLERAERVFLELREDDQAAGVIINRANVFLAMRDLNKVVVTLKSALPLARNPWLALCVRHNLIFALAELGDAQQAAEMYEQSRGLYLQHSDPLTTSRRFWAEGLIQRELGNLERARTLLAEASGRLGEHGYTYDCALSSLDLCAVYLRSGALQELVKVAAGLVRYFRSRSVHPEALAALSLLQKAAEQQVVTGTLLSEVTERLRCASERRSAAASHIH
jgi:tetratricopeptide (TPR) repeat protein